MNFIKTTTIILLTLLTIGCNSINNKTEEERLIKSSSITKEYTFSLLAVDEERAMNVDKMSQKSAEAFGDIILTDKRNENIKYLVKAKSIIDNSMIVKAEASTDELHGKNGYLIHIQLSKEGAKIFSDFTEKNVGKRVAIVLNSKVYSAPIIAQQITGGKVQITGEFSKEKAFEIVNSINLGKGKK